MVNVASDEISSAFEFRRCDKTQYCMTWFVDTGKTLPNTAKQSLETCVCLELSANLHKTLLNLSYSKMKVSEITDLAKPEWE